MPAPSIPDRTDPRWLFGQRLVSLRKSKGLSQEQLALQSGLARSYLGGVERGQRNIALLNICRLSLALGVAPAGMLNFEAELSANDAWMASAIGREGVS